MPRDPYQRDPQQRDAQQRHDDGLLNAFRHPETAPALGKIFPISDHTVRTIEAQVTRIQALTAQADEVLRVTR